MVTKTVEKKIDDWDGVSEAHKTVRFSYEGKHYEMDLSVDNHNMVHGKFGEFIGKAREVKTASRGRRGATHKVTRTATTAANKEYLNAVREWARLNGYTVADRGRVPNHVIEAYDAKH